MDPPFIKHDIAISKCPVTLLSHLSPLGNSVPATDDLYSKEMARIPANLPSRFFFSDTLPVTGRWYCRRRFAISMPGQA